MIFLTDGIMVCDADVDGVDPCCCSMSKHSALISAISNFLSCSQESTHILPDDTKNLFGNYTV